MSYCNKHKSYSCSCSCNNCGCLFPSNSDCLKYKGSYLECLDISNGDVLTDIIVKVNDAICDGIIPASGNIYVLESCDSNINVTSEVVNNTTTYTVCLSDTITDQLTENTTNIASLQTCCDKSIKELISSDGSVIVSDNGSGTWDITISNPSGFYWSTGGNGGTDPNVNFIGTIDAQDLVFKVNNIESGRINISNSNTSFGQLALNSITSGSFNCAFGGAALPSLTTGSYNTAVGLQSMILLSTGSRNTAIGSGSLPTITSGGYNTGIGESSLLNVSTGSYNTGLGYNARTNSNSSVRRIALGADALATADYQFAIPDDVTTIKFKGITYTLPTSLPVTTGVLTCDSSGNLTWA